MTWPAARAAKILIRVPTGMGKTLGVLGVWIHHRVVRSDLEWPRRLVWCLPIRVLVEQTAGEVRRALQRVHQSFPKLGPVGVHELMGGADSGDWHLYPERDAVLIGTQDMLLSRALNRGYGCPRARWPMDFGLLSHDCLWVLDEVQLAEVEVLEPDSLRREVAQRLRAAAALYAAVAADANLKNRRQHLDSMGRPACEETGSSAEPARVHARRSKRLISP